MVSPACKGGFPSFSGASASSEMAHNLASASASASADRDDDLTDTDSAYGEDSLIGDDTETLTSYITDYRYEFGRRYHAYHDGAYWGPNDENANEQQDLAHHMYFLTLDGKLHLAPIIKDPQEILDLGTGNGIWAIDAADQYPSARVTGVDLSPIQPTSVPPNCMFEIDDITLLPWAYPRNQFDFIHIRELFGCIPDWDEFFRQCWQCLKPGGYIEVVEHSVQPVADDETMAPDHFYHEWGTIVVESGERFGKTFRIWEESASRLKRAGFVDVVEVGFKWPMNGWSSDPKLHELGRWNQLRLNTGIEGFMLRLLTSTLGWSYETAQIHLAQMRAALRDYRTHAYLPGTVVYARKPMPPSSAGDD
ncbi:hypothetical protein BDV12DRAFT_174479 [Aspergillus spectabilis]